MPEHGEQTAIEYGLRFVCDGRQEGHEGHSSYDDYDRISHVTGGEARRERWMTEGGGHINGHLVELVKRTVTYGPWEPHNASQGVGS